LVLADGALADGVVVRTAYLIKGQSVHHTTLITCEMGCDERHLC
jgi:hypothetical protein